MHNTDQNIFNELAAVVNSFFISNFNIIVEMNCREEVYAQKQSGAEIIKYYLNYLKYTIKELDNSSGFEETHSKEFQFVMDSNLLQVTRELDISFC